MPNVEKEFVEPNALVRDAFALARDIYDSGYRPDVLLVLWRGGTPVGIVVHEFLLFKGVETYHTVVKAESYDGIGQRRTPKVEHLDCVVDTIAEDAQVLVVDDIFDTGRTLELVKRILGRRTPNVRIATLYHKIGTNETDLEPDYCLRRTSRWVVFPHELVGLSLEEIRTKDPYVHSLLA